MIPYIQIPGPCPDNPSQLTAQLIPEIAYMTPAQLETLRIETDDYYQGEFGHRIAWWDETPDHLIGVVLTETVEGCRAPQDSRQQILLSRPVEPFPRDD